MWMPILREKVELPNGKIVDDFYLWNEGDIVICIPIFSNKDVLVVRQYRHGYGDFSVEFPAGAINANETPEQAVVRELKEETGHSPDKLNLLCKLKTSPGKMRGFTYIYTAEVRENSVEKMLDETEDIESFKVVSGEIHQLILSGDIVDPRIIAGWYHYQSRLSRESR